MDKAEPSGFAAVLQNYAQSHRAYRAFLGHVSSSLSQLEAEPPLLTNRLAPLLKDLNPEEFKELSSALTSLIRAIEKARAESADQEGDSFSLQVKGKAGHALTQLLKIAARHVPPSQHRDLLYGSIVTGLVTQLEVLIADLAHQFYLRAPGAAETDDKVLSVNELREFDQVEDAVAFVVERRIDDLLRGSPDHWRDFMQSRMGIDLVETTPDWERFKEHVQRRHLLVHTGGRVSRRYLKGVSPELLEELLGEVSVGDRIKLTEDYVEACLTSFAATGLRLGFSCWTKLVPGEARRAETLLSDLLYEQLLERRFEVAEHLAILGEKEPSFSDATRSVCRINKWLAKKTLGRWNEVETAAADFDTSALHPRFAAAHAGLLDDVDRFCSVVDSNAGAGLDRQAWEEWPVFDGIRDEAAFRECAERHLGRAPVAKEDGSDSAEHEGVD